MTTRLTRTREGRERGGGSVLAIALVGIVSVVLVAALTIAAVAIAGQQARTAADLAALAGAGLAIQGGDEASVCAVASSTAANNRATLSSCRLERTAIDRATGVELPAVHVQVTRGVGGTGWTIQVRAAAGGVPRDS
ncbi:MAG: hypothetical protein Q4P07_11065 [Ornithinimicrobium sp.]|uniref:Rv3654c family TadE-like protein n=1 Tax=Ornithinimicrobium sp. TaxID=1977084 RepID=UPI0026E01696|nr:Rv3654c family TadE-like protein [Ornithinimicrobium sp.]MDO5740674.1 hypothetical protein [Ornithinimicrobium sp.]